MFGFRTQIDFGFVEDYDLPPWQNQIKSNSNKGDLCPNTLTMANIQLFWSKSSWFRRTCALIAVVFTELDGNAKTTS